MIEAKRPLVLDAFEKYNLKFPSFSKPKFLRLICGASIVSRRHTTGWSRKSSKVLRLVLDGRVEQLSSRVCQQFLHHFPSPSVSSSDEEEARFDPMLFTPLALSFYYVPRRRKMTDIWQPTPGIWTRASHWLVCSVEG